VLRAAARSASKVFLSGAAVSAEPSVGFRFDGPSTASLTGLGVSFVLANSAVAAERKRGGYAVFVLRSVCCAQRVALERSALSALTPYTRVRDRFQMVYYTPAHSSRSRSAVLCAPVASPALESLFLRHSCSCPTRNRPCGLRRCVVEALGQWAPTRSPSEVQGPLNKKNKNRAPQAQFCGRKPSKTARFPCALSVDFGHPKHQYNNLSTDQAISRPTWPVNHPTDPHRPPGAPPWAPLWVYHWH